MWAVNILTCCLLTVFAALVFGELELNLLLLLSYARLNSLQ